MQSCVPGEATDPAAQPRADSASG